MTSLIDNDIVLKASCYGLIDEILVPLCESTNRAGVLGTARFVISNRIKRIELNSGYGQALQRMQSLLESVAIVEPTDDEQRIAADFELAAQRAAVSLDTGESQLCAVALSRGVPWLLTGDKRAIAGIDILMDHDQRLSYLCGRVCCLEQMVFRALAADSAASIHAAVCAEPMVDKALAICFSCRNEYRVEVTAECLNSYVEDLRGRARRVLAA